MDGIFPPFEPGRRKRRRRVNIGKVPLRILVPNMVTLLALCTGLTSIRLAIEGRYELAIVAILVAAILDGIDGRVARLLKSTTRFGAELDSLTDFVNFGVSPAVLLYIWVLDDLRSLGWIAALVFAIAAALRLARFNISIDDPSKPDWHANFFVGMPAPAGALTVLLPLYLYFLGVPTWLFPAPVVLLYCLAVAFMLVSRVPTFSGKRLGARVRREFVLPLFVVTVLLAALLVSFTWHVLAAGTVIYLACLPLGMSYYRRLEREHEAAGGANAPTDPVEPPL